MWKSELHAGLGPYSVKELQEGHCEGTQRVVGTLADPKGFGGQVKDLGCSPPKKPQSGSH